MDFGDLQPNSTMVLKAAAHLERGISPNHLLRGPRRYSDGSTDEFIWPSVSVKNDFCRFPMLTPSSPYFT